MVIFMEIMLLVLAYLLGSIPSALIISKVFFNIDIRDYGSHNMGSTNVLRVLGFRYGIITFIMDAIKAGLIVFLFRINLIPYEVYSHVNPLFYGLAAVIGHIFPIFAGFKGGKGIACGAGIILAYAPIHFSIAFIVFITVFIIFKYVSLSSLSAALSLVVTSFIIPISGKIDVIYIVFVCIIFVIVTLTHRKNIIKLLKGEENKITRSNSKPIYNKETINKNDDTSNKHSHKTVIICNKDSKFVKR